jgi:DnaD/phage-associated family protein
MSIIRTMKRENPFVQLDKNFIGNETMSLKATGLLTYILSKPDGWQIRMKDIQNRFTDGETSVRSAMKEAIKLGYINRYRERSEDGTFGEWVYEVYERPEFNPKRENHDQVDSPKRDFPDLDNPEQENHGYSNNDLSNNDLSNIKEEEEEGSQYIDVINLVENNITKVNDVIRKSIKEWLNKLPYEVVLEEVNNCIKRSAKTWLYVENTLDDDFRNGILTLDQVKDKVNNHKKGKKKQYKGKQPVRKEMLPDWYKEQDAEETTKIDSNDDYDFEKEKAKLEQELKEFRSK